MTFVTRTTNKSLHLRVCLQTHPHHFLTAFAHEPLTTFSPASRNTSNMATDIQTIAQLLDTSLIPSQNKQGV